MKTRTIVSSDDWIAGDWPAPPNVRSLMTTRRGGVSRGAFASFNLGAHVGDDPAHIVENRRRLAISLPAQPLWLNQKHGVGVIDADSAAAGGDPPEADAAVARSRHKVCAVLTADCLPVLLCDQAGSVVAAAHAGWRGLLAGILAQTVAAMRRPPGELLAYFGPAIGPQAFEVGKEVRAAFVAADTQADAAFKPLPADKWLANIYLLAQQSLASLGVNAIYGGEYCTVCEEERFFSYRRDGTTGRMASLIWLEESDPARGK
jgi:polyphenol oxidase